MKQIINVHASLVAVGEEMIGDSLRVALQLIPIILVALLAIAIVKSLMAHRTVTMDYSLLIRGLILFFVVMFYEDLMQMLSYTLNAIIGSFQRPEGFLSSLEEMAKVGLLDENGEQNTGLLGRALQAFRNLPVMIAIWMQEGLTLAIRLGISLVRSYLLVFLYLVGPISLAVSMIPGFRMTGLLWLKAFIGAQLWDLTLTLIDNLAYAYCLNFLSDPSAGAGGYLHALTAQGIIVLLFLISPALTNYFLNSASASQVWGKFSAMMGTAFLFGPRLGNKRKTPPSKKV